MRKGGLETLMGGGGGETFGVGVTSARGARKKQSHLNISGKGVDYKWLPSYVWIGGSRRWARGEAP